jgi:D-arabinose 1-dehydrogenase-like Zn-dependent alcohol dehydrogenase
VKNAAEELQKLGGARAIIATAPDSKAMTEMISGFDPNGRLVLIGVSSNLLRWLRFSLSGAARLLKDGQG